MVRTNTRDDGPGLSHTSVEGYFDPAQYRREVDVLFRKHPIVVGHSGPGAQGRATSSPTTPPASRS